MSIAQARGTTGSEFPSWPFLGLGAYLITSIFYVFPSGAPQPADFLLLMVCLAVFVVPIMLYGLAYKGLRFSLFWVTPALIYAQGRHARLEAGAEARAVATALAPAPEAADAPTALGSIAAGADGGLSRNL